MILRRYILRRACATSLFVWIAGILFFVVVDLMGTAQQIARGSLTEVVRLYLLRCPEIAATLLPVALVLGPLLALGSLSKHYELAAMKYTGASMQRVLLPPLLGLALVAAGVLATLSEWALPRTAPRAVELQDQVFALRGPRFWAFYQPRRWLRTPSGFLHASSLHGGNLHDVTYVRHNAAFLPVQLIRAAELQARPDGYSLIAGTSRALDPVGAPLVAFDALAFPEPLAAGSLAQHLGFPEVFDVRGLLTAVREGSIQGGNVVPFQLALWRRLGDPLLLLALALLVIPFAAWAKRGQPTERRLIEGALILGYYFAVRGGFGTLAAASASSCALAALGPPAVTLGLAALLLLRVEVEHPVG
ncbi:MAG: LptF/LptG family permease [Deltaproteobacteria bacterium]|nr:LptF/LptG family permease [Deltaproteobacteria bacterium]